MRAKADHSPVTAADRQSEEIILEALARVAPGVAVIAEEAVTAGHIPELTGPFFLVDPLDGTNGFVKGRTAFTINIALIEDRRPAFGLVYAPALADFYVTLSPEEAANARLEPGTPAGSLAEAGFKPIRSRVPDPNALCRAREPVAPDAGDRALPRGLQRDRAQGGLPRRSSSA